MWADIGRCRRRVPYRHTLATTTAWDVWDTEPKSHIRPTRHVPSPVPRRQKSGRPNKVLFSAGYDSNFGHGIPQRIRLDALKSRREYTHSDMNKHKVDAVVHCIVTTVFS